MELWGEIHVTVDKTVKYDAHIKSLADFPRHWLPISALPSGFSGTLPFWRVLLITSPFLCLCSAPFFKNYKHVWMQNLTN